MIVTLILLDPVLTGLQTMITVIYLSGLRGLVRLPAAKLDLLLTTLPAQVHSSLLGRSVPLCVLLSKHCDVYHSSGNYYYVEASSPAQEGNKAWLLSNKFPATAGRCLSFWYHMYGSSIGSLNVYLVDEDNKATLVWSKSGDQGNQWNEAKPTIESKQNYKVG